MKYPIFNDDLMREYAQMTPEQRKQYGAVWTPPELISKMMAKCDDSFWTDPTKTCLDPTCGSGNIVVCMIFNKIYHGVSVEQAIKNVYGVELQMENVKICRNRILKIFGEKYRPIVEKNIVCSDIFLWNINEWRKYTKNEIKEMAKTDKIYKRYL